MMMIRERKKIYDPQNEDPPIGEGTSRYVSNESVNYLLYGI